MKKIFANQLGKISRCSYNVAFIYFRVKVDASKILTPDREFNLEPHSK